MSPLIRVANKLIPETKAKWLKIRLSIPAKSKIAEKMLEPADEGSYKLTPETKSKMAENIPEHPGQEQNS